MSQGDLQKAWLRLRHFIAVAELMGLPNASQAVQSGQANGVERSETQLHRAQLWQSFCAADGISGVVLNLPPSISPSQRPKPQTLAIDGVVQPRAYMSRLIAITTKIQYRDSTNATIGSNAQLYASTLELDRELKVLAAETPKSWWVQPVGHVQPHHLVQFLHCCINMRIHLSFAMRTDLDEQYTYSRLTCRRACESVTEHYRFLRRGLPSGIFLSRCLDLQVFIATIVLHLTCQSSPCTSLPNTRVDQVKVDSVVTEVIEVMCAQSKNTAVSHFAQHCVKSIRSLKGLLQKDDGVDLKELTLKVPLLGKVHVRRNCYMRETASQYSVEVSAEAGSSEPNEHFTNTQEHGCIPLEIAEHTISSSNAQQEVPWDPFSWSIEDPCGDCFQDTLMLDDTNEFTMY
jgi:hypothetical protein